MNNKSLTPKDKGFYIPGKLYYLYCFSDTNNAGFTKTYNNKLLCFRPLENLPDCATHYTNPQPPNFSRHEAELFNKHEPVLMYIKPHEVIWPLGAASYKSIYMEFLMASKTFYINSEFLIGKRAPAWDVKLLRWNPIP